MSMRERIAGLLDGVSPERLEEILRRGEKLTIRLSASEKAGIKASAKRWGITMTDYLLRLHAEAEEILAAAGVVESTVEHEKGEQ